MYSGELIQTLSNTAAITIAPTYQGSTVSFGVNTMQDAFGLLTQYSNLKYLTVVMNNNNNNTVSIGDAIGNI